MKNLINLLLSKKVELLISLSFFLILFNNQISALVIGALIVVIFLDKKNYKFKLTKNIVFTIIFFAYLIIRELFDVNPKKGFDFIIRLLPILLLCLTLNSYKFNKTQVDFITNIFIWINYVFYALAVFYGLFIFSIDYNNVTIQGFNYYQWVVPVKIKFHPPYWGLLIVLSMIIVLINHKMVKNKKYTFIGISFFFLLLLSSRISLLAALIIFGIYILFINSSAKYKKLLLLVSILITSSIFIFSSPYLSKKISDNSGISDRLKLWEASQTAMQDHFYFGNSLSQYQLAIQSVYDNNNPSIENYDPHNQFIHFGVSIGIIGLLLFLMSMFYSENYQIGQIMFFIVIVLSFMTESVISRQMGVILYALFLNLLSNKSFTNVLFKKL